MIYTVTMNPSLDYMITLKKIREGALNRAEHENIFAGGKGINVSLVLQMLGVENRCLGFLAGRLGEKLEEMLKTGGCNTDFIFLRDGETRINVKIHDGKGKETEFNGNGPSVGKENLAQLIQKLELLQKGDILVLSGNLQADMPKDSYVACARTAKSKGAELIVDTEKKYMLPILQMEPVLIKPNQYELSDMTDCSLESLEDVCRAAEKLLKAGVQNVLVSMGNKGAFFCGRDGARIYIEAPRGTVINTVGSGDAMIAGFLYAKSRNYSLTESVRYAVATGSAGAFSEHLPDKDAVDGIYPYVVAKEYCKSFA